MVVRRKLIRRQVDDLLRENGIEAPPVPVDLVARNAGIAVRYQPAEDDLSGFILRGKTVPKDWKAVIGINELHSENRQRFSLAHEIGHFFLHAGDSLHVDKESIFQVKLRGPEASRGTNIEEREANAFAAELLMPQSFLEEDLEGLDVLDDEYTADLAKKYGVSHSALSFRLANLGYRLE